MKKRSLKDKVLSPAKAKLWSEKNRRKGLKVVFTNGCFDILHTGHVSYLESAKNKGDLLIVALDTDESVRSLKGDSRPVNDLKSRLAVVAALESVDVVTWFAKSNPVPTIKKLQPSVLVKGGDWKIPKILGSKEVLSWGGKVFSIRYVSGKSTTEMIKKIRSL